MIQKGRETETETEREREREKGRGREREICTCWKEDGQKESITEMLIYLVS